MTTPLSTPIRVMLVDDHEMVRQGLALFLDTLDDMTLVGEASSGEEALPLCASVKPDVIILDLIMPGMDGVSTLRAIHAAYPSIAVIILTSSGDHELVRDALQAGAMGYLLKNAAIAELAQAIRSAYAGKRTFSAGVTQLLIGAASQPPPPTITLAEREREVLKLMAQGLTNRQIAQKMSINYSTVKFYVSNILAKLNVASRTEAVALALQYHLVN